jgi:hypothetical protein
VSLDLPPELVEDLTEAARSRVVGRGLLIEHLLRDGLERLVPVEELVRRRSQREEVTS